MLYILKFGGSSLANTCKIKSIANYIKQLKTRENVNLIVVVSAMGKTTNKLIKLSESVCKNSMSTAKSSLMCLGENISNYMLSLALEEIGVESISLTSKDIKIYAQGSPDCGLITFIDKSLIEKHLNEDKVVIVSGFQGENALNQTITLGRGGSDTTAVALGNLFNAPVKIFTDVKGFYSLNPSNYKHPKLLKTINIKSAIDLANVNTKVLDYRSLCLANQSRTNLTVSKSLSKNGTIINYGVKETYQIDGISSKSKILFVKNTTKNSIFIQSLLQNSNFKTFFYNINTHEIWATDSSKKTLKTIFDANKQKFIIKNADILVLTGSGLLIHKDFIKKVQIILKQLKICILFFNLTQTSLTIITKQNQSKKLELELGKALKLIKEL